MNASTLQDIEHVRHLIVDFILQSYNDVKHLRDERTGANNLFINDENPRWKQWAEYLWPDARNKTTAQIEAYCANMRQSRIWGTDLEIRAAAIIWDIRIESFIYSYEASDTTISN